MLAQLIKTDPAIAKTRLLHDVLDRRIASEVGANSTPIEAWLSQAGEAGRSSTIRSWR